MVTPLPFLYESTGDETMFTDGLDPEPRSRPVVTFHRPETLARWLRHWIGDADGGSLRARLERLGPEGLRRIQVDAIKPRRGLDGPQLSAALAQMPTALHAPGPVPQFLRAAEGRGVCVIDPTTSKPSPPTPPPIRTS